jgi:hypothetical protein
MNVVLSYGTGLESTAILARWLEDPSSRDFALEDLVVLTAHTGDDWTKNAELVEQHILPRLRARGVRYVQVARAGLFEAAGVKVLEDSRSPARCFQEGAYRLSDELREAGTVPQFVSGRRRCSVKYKGFPMDAWLDREFGPRPVEAPVPEPLPGGSIIYPWTDGVVRALEAKAHVPAQAFRHVIGFNVEELFRVARDRSYSTVTRQSEYPLVTWGWTRADCERYLLEVLGVRWPKSCCEQCPFSAGKRADVPMTLERMRSHPEAACRALTIERRSLALNPRSTLYANGSLAGMLEAHGAGALVETAERQLATAPWAVYRVRRYYHRKGVGWRSVQVLWQGAMEDGLAALRREAGGLLAVLEAGCWRAHVHRRGVGFPAAEEMFVLGPAGVTSKERAGFAEKWAAAAGGAQYQQALAL